MASTRPIEPSFDRRDKLSSRRISTLGIDFQAALADRLQAMPLVRFRPMIEPLLKDSA